jgi:hypothetical protein
MCVAFQNRLRMLATWNQAQITCLKLEPKVDHDYLISKAITKSHDLCWIWQTIPIPNTEELLNKRVEVCYCEVCIRVSSQYVHHLPDTFRWFEQSRNFINLLNITVPKS